MNKIKHSESGFGIVELLLIIVIVGLLGVVGWMVYENHHKPVATTAATTSTRSTAPTTTPATTTTKPAVKVDLGNLEYPCYQNGDTMTIYICPQAIYPSGDVSELWVDYGLTADSLTGSTPHITQGLASATPHSQVTQKFSIAETSLKTGTTYSYRVAAKDTSGQVIYSTVSTFKTGE